MKRFLILFVVLFTAVLFVYCGRNKEVELEIIKEYPLKVLEPSGLAMSYDRNNLWSVSDQNSTVYLLSLNGTIQRNFTVNAGDLEGIDVVSDTSIAVVAERTREIIFLNNDGKEYLRKKILNDDKNNSGLEGIAVNRRSGHIFLVKEKHPKLLIECNNNLSELTREEINFADDLSGLDFQEGSDDLWIISDENKLIAKCSTSGRIKEKFKIKIDQIEGIAVDAKSKVIYLVSDKEEKLYILGMK